MTDITAKLAEALREAFNAGRAQGTDEATAYDWGSRASQSADQAFTDMLADWNATDVPAITELRATLTAYTASQSTPDEETVERVARALATELAKKSPPRFQGFDYREGMGLYVIRDFKKAPGQQSVWRGTDRDEMMREIERLEATELARAAIAAYLAAVRDKG